MDPIEHRRGSTVGGLRALVRWGLLGAVIAAVFALHVLTAEHTPGQHGGVEGLATEGHSLVVLHAGPIVAIDLAGDGPTVTIATVGLVEHPGGGPELLLGCVLFLVVAGPAALVALRRGRRTVEPPPRSASGVPLGQVRLTTRSGVPRLALCVIRI